MRKNLDFIIFTTSAFVWTVQLFHTAKSFVLTFKDDYRLFQKSKNRDITFLCSSFFTIASLLFVAILLQIKRVVVNELNEKYNMKQP